MHERLLRDCARDVPAIATLQRLGSELATATLMLMAGDGDRQPDASISESKTARHSGEPALP